jgi:hypothetical protein
LYSFYVNASKTEFDLLALCNKIGATQQNPDDPYEWTVTCEYSTRTFDPKLLNKNSGQDTGGSDPLSRSPDVQWSFLPFTRPMVRDGGSIIWAGDGNGKPQFGSGLASGTLILNTPGQPIQPINPRVVSDSAGTPFDPPLEYDDSRMVMNYRRNEAFYDPIVARLYKDAINTDVFLQNSPNIVVKNPDGTIGAFGGLPPGSVKCANIGAVRKFESSTFYFEINYEFHISFDGWFAAVPDAGYYQLDSNGNRTPILDAKNNPVISPWPLNGAGVAYTADQVTNQGRSSFNYFFPYRELPFAPLGIV